MGNFVRDDREYGSASNSSSVGGLDEDLDAVVQLQATHAVLDAALRHHRFEPWDRLDQLRHVFIQNVGLVGVTREEHDASELACLKHVLTDAGEVDQEGCGEPVFAATTTDRQPNFTRRLRLRDGAAGELGEGLEIRPGQGLPEDALRDDPPDIPAVAAE